MTVEFRLNNCVSGFMRLTRGFLSSSQEVIFTRPVTHRIPLKHTTRLKHNQQCNLHIDAKNTLVINSDFNEHMRNLTHIIIFDPKQNEFVCIVGAWK